MKCSPSLSINDIVQSWWLCRNCGRNRFNSIVTRIDTTTTLTTSNNNNNNDDDDDKNNNNNNKKKKKKNDNNK